MDFYYNLASVPCRSVLMTAAALNVKLNLKPLDSMKKEHLTTEFLKLNPQHTVPTLVDNDFAIWESRAICVYLLDKVGDCNSLYPKEPKTRAVINQRLYFDMGTLFKPFVDYYFASFYGKPQLPEDLTKLKEAVEYLNKFLDNTEFVAGTQEMSVADLVLFASVSTFELFAFDFTPYPKVAKWLAMMKSTAPGRELNEEGLELMKSILAARA